MPEVAAPTPTMYRWVSSARPPVTSEAKEGDVASVERVMTLTFSVPVAVFPQQQGNGGEDAMQVDGATASLAQLPRIPPSAPPTCDVQGCKEIRKYRLVRDFKKGACGMGHLKVLEAQSA